MADSVYISAHLNKDQMEFMRLLDDYEIDIFRFKEVEELINHQFSNLNEVLENLVQKKFLSRIERGKFCRANFRDEFVIGTFVVKLGAIAYWSALNLHGLTEQFPNTVFIQTIHKKRDKSIFGVDYQFVKIAPGKWKGVIKHGRGNRSYNITDVEKTLVDCFDLQQYSGGYAELIRALERANISSVKMIEYCKAVNNGAATKRIGYLTELLNKKGMKNFIRFAENQVGESYNPLDPQGAEKGFHNARWRLRLNISEAEIMDIVSKPY